MTRTRSLLNDHLRLLRERQRQVRARALHVPVRDLTHVLVCRALTYPSGQRMRWHPNSALVRAACVCVCV
jgi:hypothetical protein